MNKTQRQNTAKYLYDLSKIILTISAVTNYFSEKFNPVNFWIGVIFAFGLYLLAYYLDGKGEE